MSRSKNKEPPKKPGKEFVVCSIGVSTCRDMCHPSCRFLKRVFERRRGRDVVILRQCLLDETRPVDLKPPKSTMERSSDPNDFQAATRSEECKKNANRVFGWRWMYNTSAICSGLGVG